MNDLIQKIMEGSNHKITIKWPLQENQVTMRVANSHDMSMACVQADAYFKSRKVDMENAQAYLDYKESYVLYMIISVPGSDEPLCKKFEEFERLLTAEVREYLNNHHEALQDEYSPNIDKMTEAEKENHLDRLKKNFQDGISHIGNISTERHLLEYSVSLLASLQKAS